MYSVAPITIDGVTVGTITFGYEADVPTDALAPGDDPLSLPDSSASGLLGSHGHPHAARHGNSAHSEVSHEHEPVFRHGIGPGSKSRSAEISPHHITTDEVAKALKGESPKHFDVKDVKAALEGKETLKGSAYLKSERQWIADELKKDPQLHRALVALISYEQPGRGEAQRVAESLFNRLNLLRRSEPGLTLREYLSREPKNQFYGPLKHNLTSVANPRQKGGTSADVIGGDIEGALAGSNLVKGYTDQGSKGDPNYDSERASGNYVTSNGELYGDFGGGAKAYREDQQGKVARGGTVATDSDGKPVGVTSIGGKPVGVTQLAGNSAGRHAAESLPAGHRFNYFQRAGLSPSQVPRERVQTPYGEITVASAAAKDFEGFYSDLHAAGAPIKTIGSYADRNKRWGGGVSSHAYGAATDIDNALEQSQAMKNWLATHPKEFSEALHQHHMGSGVNFSHYDPNHIEWLGPGAEARVMHQSGAPLMDNPTKHGFPPTIQEFRNLYHRDPTTDEEIQAYKHVMGTAALTPLDKLVNLPETEPIARRGGRIVGAAEAAGEGSSKSPDEMGGDYGETFFNYGSTKPTIVWNPDAEKAGSLRQRETLIHEMGHAGVAMNAQLHKEYEKFFALQHFEEMRQRVADIDRLRRLSMQTRKAGSNTAQIDKLLGEAEYRANEEASGTSKEMSKMSPSDFINKAREVNRRANELARSGQGFNK